MKVFRRNTQVMSKGIGLRDYFAAQIISGICADPTVRELYAKGGQYAKTAYAVADAMLKVREE
jgi:hypothetical protein